MIATKKRGEGVEKTETRREKNKIICKVFVSKQFSVVFVDFVEMAGERQLMKDTIKRKTG